MKDFLKKELAGIKKRVGRHYGNLKMRYRKRYGSVTYSQCGEDKIIDYLFALRGIRKPSYIDIGANDPFFLNNTFKFYKKGARGLNIEANPRLVRRFNNYRPKDTNLNIGIGATESNLEFFIFEDDTLSTFSAQEAGVQTQMGHKILKSDKIDVKTLNQIVDEYCDGVFPDFLSIDVEGVDFDVMRSTDFSRSKPRVICAETAEYSPIGVGSKREDYIQFIQGLGYYLYADTNLNSIFVEQDFWFKWVKE